MYRKWLSLAAGTLTLLAPGLARGEIDSSTPFALDLTSAKVAAQKAKWAHPDGVKVTADGLGWGTAADRASLDFWLETEPVAVGLSWRPTSIATIRATVKQPGNSGMLYARYSTDAKHWTTWQLLEEATPAKEGAATQEFHGTLRVPYRERQGYDKLRLEYARRDDVPWASDEEALVKDILGRDPKFFERSTPFIGYVQFLYEAQLLGGQRLKGLDVDVGWFLSGIHRPPKDEETGKVREVPWRFKAP
jgi:hypothetical protein